MVHSGVNPGATDWELPNATRSDRLAGALKGISKEEEAQHFMALLSWLRNLCHGTELMHAAVFSKSLGLAKEPS